MATGDKYEGNWSSGKKNGFGKNIFYFQVIIFLQTVIYMKESSKMEIDKEEVNIHGLMAVIIKDNGYVIK